MTERTTVVLAGDSVLLREGLAGMLARFGFDVVAQAGDADELIAAVDEHRPQLLVTDVRRPPGFRDEGLRAALGLRAAHPSLATAVLSHTSSARTPTSCSQGRRAAWDISSRTSSPTSAR